MDYTAMGQRIREVRRARRLSQEEVAQAISISSTHMSHIETGATKLSLSVLVSLSSYLGVSTDDIIFENRTTDESSPLTKKILRLLRDCNEKELTVIFETSDAILRSIRKHLK